MISLIHLVVLVCVSQYTAGDTADECDIENVYQKLDAAKQMIDLAKGKLSKDMGASLPKDCEDLLNDGVYTSGIYQVWPINRVVSGPVSVYCDMDTDGGGWTVIQRRGNFSRSNDYFYQDWQTYKTGFGYLGEDFWLGNDNIYALSNQKQYSIRIDLRDFDGVELYAVYDKFWIEEEGNNYAIHVTGYTGNAGDSFAFQDGGKFTTKDRHNDNAKDNCAKTYTGAWWFTACYHSHLNGPYFQDKSKNGIHWQDSNGGYKNQAASEMKIRTRTI